MNNIKKIKTEEKIKKFDANKNTRNKKSIFLILQINSAIKREKIIA